MSELKAQLYAGNPLSISDDELERLNIQPPTGHVVEMRLTRKAVTRKLGSTPALFKVVVPAGRNSQDKVLAEGVTRTMAQLIVDGARYLHLLSAAVRELRAQAPEAEQARWRDGGIEHARLTAAES